jgi:hypothetical protein
MGEKPTEEDEARAKTMDKSSPELMRAAGETGTEPSEGTINTSKSMTFREGGTQEPSGEPGGPSGIAVSDPGAGGSKSDKK